MLDPRVIPSQNPRLETDPDFILLKRFGYSLAKLLGRYDIVPNDIIAQALGIPPVDVETRYQNVVQRLRKTCEKHL